MASCMHSARKTLYCLMIASKTSSVPASEPVWDATATAPFSDRPDFITTTGFFFVASLSTLTNHSPSLTPSTYMKTIFVISCVIRYSRRSDSSIPALFPTETIADIPIFSTAVLPIIDAPRTPLCVIIATLPFLTSLVPNVAFNEAIAEYIPNMFGPRIRRPCSRAYVAIFFSS